MIFGFAEICQVKVGQQVGETALCLRNQRIAVSQEQDILDPSVPQKNIAQGNNRSRLAGTGCHNQQSLAAVLFVETFADCLDCALLIIPSGDVFVHHCIFEGCPHSLEIEQLFQIALGVDGCHTAFRIYFVLPDTGIETIGKEDNWSATKLLF